MPTATPHIILKRSTVAPGHARRICLPVPLRSPGMARRFRNHLPRQKAA